jgi:hypothetical protein
VLTDFFAPPAATCAGGGRCDCHVQPGHNCRECDVLPFCLGGCPAVSLVNHGCNNFGTSLLRDGGTPGEKCAFFRDLVRQLLFLYLGAVESKDPRVLGYLSRLGYHDGLVC